MRRHVSIVLIILLALLPACRSTYYNMWEKLGWAKRDILVSRVKEARDGQEAAKQQFQTTLQRLREVAGTGEDDLQKRYDRLKADYDRCESRAQAVHERIASVEQVAGDLFIEWQKELSEYSNPELRRSSKQQLEQTRHRYDQLIAAMKRAETKMAPVLTAFHDQVLFLKHNLNARAIASLDQTRASVEADVAGLIRDMEASISEANAFVREMQAATK